MNVGSKRHVEVTDAPLRSTFAELESGDSNQWGRRRADPTTKSMRGVVLVQNRMIELRRTYLASERGTELDMGWRVRVVQGAY